MKAQILWVLILALFISGCSSFKVAEVDHETGYFPTNKKASVVHMKPFNLDARNNLILVPSNSFDLGQVKNLEYFDEVIEFGELEKRIIQANLTDKVPSLKDRIGINKAAKHYKKFLWLRYGQRQDGSKYYAQLILTDPLTLEEIFVAETYLDTVWVGVNDQQNWYPLYNSLLDYIRLYSVEYAKKHSQPKLVK